MTIRLIPQSTIPSPSNNGPSPAFTSAGVAVLGGSTKSDLMVRDPEGIYCVLEVSEYNLSKPRYHIFPVMPEALVTARRYLLTMTPTMNGVVVDQYGMAPSPISLQGTFGRRYKPHYSTVGLQISRIKDTWNNPNGSPEETITGYKLTRHLVDLVDQYNEPGIEGRPRRAFFYNFAFDEYWEVALNGISTSMTTQANFLWFYNLQMTILGKVTPSAGKNGSPRLGVKLPGFAGKFIDRALPILRKIDATLPLVAQFASRVSPQALIQFGAQYLDRSLGLPDSTVEQFGYHLRKLPEYVGAVENVLYQATTRLPNDVRRDLGTLRGIVETIGGAVQAYGATGTASSPPSVSTPTGSSLMTAQVVLQRGPFVLPATAPIGVSALPRVDAGAMELAQAVMETEQVLSYIDTALAVAGLSLNSAPPSEATAASLSPDVSGQTATLLTDFPITNAVSHMLRQYDSLSSLALQYYGSTESWPLIARANQDALVASDTMPGFSAEIAPTDSLRLAVGTEIVIPLPRTALQPMKGDIYVYDAPIGTASLGRDLPELLVSRTRSDGTKDLEVLSPESTLLQGIYHRLSTPLGGIPDVPQYGSRVPAIIGEDFGPFDDLMSSVMVREALLKDGRVSTVNDVVAERLQTAALVRFNTTLLNDISTGYIETTLTPGE